jgi:DNA (cytosine-5)-methyltransferase 1
MAPLLRPDRRRFVQLEIKGSGRFMYKLLAKCDMSSHMRRFGFYEFFAGGGMARLGLGDQWKTLLANDFNPHKAEAYASNFRPSGELVVGDVGRLSTIDLPDGGLMAWASFPCQDLSLAGNGKGLHASRSGCYWPFWRIMRDMSAQGSPVPILALENVVGLLHSNHGQDFERLLQSLHELGYYYGAMVVDAIHFLPQSRPRLFIVAARPELIDQSEIISDSPMSPWHTERIIESVAKISTRISDGWVWWKIPPPPMARVRMEDIVMDCPPSVEWHNKTETEKLLSLMAPLHRRKVEAASRHGKKVVGTIYKRTRLDPAGHKSQRAEVRFDGVAGCLRTPAGGSSRQTIIVVEGRKIRTCLLDPREAARLMGVPEWYKLPNRYNDAYHLMGDGLAVPAVSWVEKHVLRPLARAACAQQLSRTEAVA